MDVQIETRETILCLLLSLMVDKRDGLAVTIISAMDKGKRMHQFSE